MVTIQRTRDTGSRGNKDGIQAAQGRFLNVRENSSGMGLSIFQIMWGMTANKVQKITNGNGRGTSFLSIH